MPSEHQIVADVYAAREDMQKADALIEAYLPFIRHETSKFLNRPCTEQDDEHSIAMIAFHEAICGYSRERGAFLRYAAMLIRSRLIDYQRSEARHKRHVSLDEDGDEDTPALRDKLADGEDKITERDNLDAARQEIDELAQIMAGFGVTFADIAENCPKQERTRQTCRRAVEYAIANPMLLDALLQTKKLPLAELTVGAGVERKTLERHRKYLLAMLLIQTNGYEIIRGHLRYAKQTKGGVTPCAT